MSRQEDATGQLRQAVQELRAQVAALEAARTDCQRMAGELRQREALLRTMIENFPFDFWARDPSGRCFLQSHRSVENWGDLCGLAFDEQRVDPQTLATWRAAYEQAMRGEVVEGEAQLVARDGRRHDFYRIVAPIVDSEGLHGTLGISIDRTEQNRTQELLSASEARYRALVESSEDAIYQMDVQGRLLFVNAAGARMLGLLPADVVGRTPFEVFGRDAATPLMNSVQAVFRTGRSNLVERSMVIAGRRIELSTVLAPVLSAEGQVTSVVGISRDITAHKDAAAALQETEQKFYAFVAHSLYGYVELELDGHVAFVNHRAAEISGYLPEEMVGEHVTSFLVLADRERAMENIRRAAVDRQDGPNFYRAIRKDGQLRTIAINSVALRVGGRPIKVLNLLIDVTDRQNTEEALRQSEARLGNLFANMPDLVLVVDSQATIRFANHAAPGATPEQLVGSRGFGYIIPEHQPICQQAFAQAMARRQVERVEVRDIYDHWWNCRLAPIFEGDCVNSLLIICTDVTERKRAEAEVLREQQLLRELLEVYERERKLVSYEIHDALSQPLAGAVMSFEAALQQVPEDHRQETRTAFDRVLHLLRHGLAETRRLMRGLRPSILDDFGVVAAIDALIQEIRAEEVIQVEWSHDVQFTRLVPPLETTLYRIAQEGVNNAVLHSGSDRVCLTLVQEGQRLRLSIEDWGRGFDPEQTASQHFGLQGIRERARLAGGTAEIHSASGQGTSITVTLPVVEAAPEEVD